MLPRSGDVLRVTRAASVQFVEPMLFRVIRVHDWPTYDGWAWLENRWLLLDGTATREYRWLLRTYSGSELAGLLREAGFATVRLFGSLAGSAYDDQAIRLVALATKAPASSADEAT